VIERAVMLVWLLIVGVPLTLHLLRTTGVGLADLMSPAPAQPVADASESGEADVEAR
jgi:hypothetical protein